MQTVKDDLRAKLRAKSKSDYCVNEKVSQYGYERRWKLYVLHNNGIGRTYWGSDDERGLLDVYRRALADADRLGGDTDGAH